MDKFKVFSGTTRYVEAEMNAYTEDGYVVKEFGRSGSPGYFYCVMELPDALYKPDPTTDAHSAWDEPDKVDEVCPVEGCVLEKGHKPVVWITGTALHIKG